MAWHPHAGGAVAIALALVAVFLLLGRPAVPEGAVRLAAQGRVVPARPAPAAAAPQEPAPDPLLTPGLRDTLELLLLEAGEASDPAQLKQRLAQTTGTQFPAALATRALALAERYVDYRVALG